SLYPYFITPELCTGCGICVSQCGKKAITIPAGERRALIVNQDKCLRCGKCFFLCEYNSIIQQPDDDGVHPYKYLVNLDTCVNCMSCYDICHAPVSEQGPGVTAIEIFNDENRARIDQTLCSHCGECVELEFCPNTAIFEGPAEPGETT
ncbi:4Fe-4S binding protein, partial [Myxococcota bacterium]|nr:4Fe-4S binding protein [Myxococcota bacterium]